MNYEHQQVSFFFSIPSFIAEAKTFVPARTLNNLSVFSRLRLVENTSFCFSHRIDCYSIPCWLPSIASDTIVLISEIDALSVYRFSIVEFCGFLGANDCLAV